jgi:hypothetical protein
LIAFLDGDDTWHPKKLERQLEEFSKDPIPGLCYTNLYDCDPNLVPIKGPRRFRKRVCERVFEELYCNPFPIPPSTAMVKKEAFTQCGYFDEGMKKVEDYECWLRISMLYSISCITEALCYRRLHGYSISSTYNLGEKLDWEFAAIDRCAIAANKFNISLPMSVENRKIHSVRLRLRKSLLWNDKNGTIYYKNKLKKLGCYNIYEKLIFNILTLRNKLLDLIKLTN